MPRLNLPRNGLLLVWVLAGQLALAPGCAQRIGDIGPPDDDDAGDDDAGDDDAGDDDVGDDDSGDDDVGDDDVGDDDVGDDDVGDDDSASSDPCSDSPAAESIAIDDECRVDYAISQDPNLDIIWQVSSFAESPCHREVMMTPLVVPLTDSDGDGLVGPDDERAVVFTTFCGNDYHQDGMVRAVAGNGAAMLWSATESAYRVQPDAALAAGDIDGDGWPEIVGVHEDGRLLAFDHEGNGIWQSASNVPDGGERGAPFLADLDGDGSIEILFGNQIYDAQGVLVGEGAHGRGANASRQDFPTSFAADIDLNGTQEVVVGNALYTREGNSLWFNGEPDGFPAVGNFDSDPEAEIVVVFTGQVRLQDTDGTVIAGPVTLPGTGSGGPPTVADFDGDGLPEIGVASLAFYTMFDSDLSVLWSNPTVDLSSSITGSSAFDFDADGSSEVVYADEHDVWVWHGATGDLVFQGSGHASGTHLEYPVVAQVTGDGAPEIVVASNHLIDPGWNGITVLADSGRTWMPTRSVWNQHAFMPTHVGDDLSIPANPTMPWQLGQGFRQNEVTTTPGVAAADLSLELHARCPDGSGELLRLRAANSGSVAAGPFDVVVHDAVSGNLLATKSLTGLSAGTLGSPFDIELGSLAIGATVFATVDLDGDVVECNNDNNAIQVNP